MTPHRARSRSAIALTSILVLVAGSNLLSTTARADSCEAKPFIVKIHADWCGSCRATRETWDRIETELADQATVVELDVSDRVAYTASADEAERLGLADFFVEYSRRTGVIAVLDCESLKPVVVLGGERDFDKYRDAVRKASRSS